MRRAYTTDLSDQEWEVIEPHLPVPQGPGRPKIHPTREILDAVFYIVRGGCAWRLLPHDLPPWKTVHHYFRLWRIDGTWERLNAALRERLRVRLGRDPRPSAGSVDSQSVKSTGVGGEERGYDGGKQIKGRKRHILVDTEGLLPKAKVHSAKVFDRDGIKLLLEGAKEMFPRLSHLWLDAGYNGEGRGKDWVEKVMGWTARIVKRPRRWVRVPEGEEPPPYPKGFIVLPRRWVVERTFSWIGQNRRMSKDYERLPEDRLAEKHLRSDPLVLPLLVPDAQEFQLLPVFRGIYAPSPPPSHASPSREPSVGRVGCHEWGFAASSAVSAFSP